MKKLNSWMCLLLLVLAAGILPACSGGGGAVDGHSGPGDAPDSEATAPQGDDSPTPPADQGPETPQDEATPSGGDAPGDDYSESEEEAPAPVDSHG